MPWRLGRRFKTRGSGIAEVAKGYCRSAVYGLQFLYPNTILAAQPQ